MNLQAWIIAKKMTLFFQLLGCLNVGFQKKKNGGACSCNNKTTQCSSLVERRSEAREKCKLEVRERVHGDGVSNDIVREKRGRRREQ